MKKKNEHIAQLEDQFKKREEEVEALRKIIEIERFGVYFFQCQLYDSLFHRLYSPAMLTAVFLICQTSSKLHVIIINVRKRSMNRAWLKGKGTCLMSSSCFCVDLHVV